MTDKVICATCGSYMQAVGGGFRCPWAYGIHFLRAERDGVVYLSCDRPYKDAKGRVEIQSPISGSVNR